MTWMISSEPCSGLNGVICWQLGSPRSFICWHGPYQCTSVLRWRTKTSFSWIQSCKTLPIGRKPSEIDIKNQSASLLPLNPKRNATVFRLRRGECFFSRRPLKLEAWVKSVEKKRCKVKSVEIGLWNFRRIQRNLVLFACFNIYIHIYIYIQDPTDFFWIVFLLEKPTLFCTTGHDVWTSTSPILEGFGGETCCEDMPRSMASLPLVVLEATVTRQWMGLLTFQMVESRGLLCRWFWVRSRHLLNSLSSGAGCKTVRMVNRIKQKKLWCPSMRMILLMDEILHHLGWLKPYK